jgi:hypothetical protein
MKSQKLFLILIAVMGLGSLGYAQKHAVYSGDFSVLRNQQVLVKYDYSTMTMGEMPSEQAYIDKRVAEYDAKKAGKGEKWLAEWKEIRKTADTEFVRWFNKKSKKYGVVASLTNEQAPYTIIMKAISLEIGWSAGLVSGAGIVQWHLSLYKSDDLAHPIAEMNLNGVADIETTKGRMIGMYRVTAENFAKFLKKRVFD